MSIFDSLSQFGSIISNKVNTAFDANNHGFLDGNWDDFQLGFTRIGGVVPNVVANNVDIISRGASKGINNVLSPLSNNPSFYIVGGIAILGLLIVGYGAIKVGKYI